MKVLSRLTGLAPRGIFVRPFLRLPFASHPYSLTEGWEYSEVESSISGLKVHGGIDYELPLGTEVLASASGWAIASYWNSPWFENGVPRLYRGKYIRVGYGRFVQIYHPDQKLYSIYAHLERVVDVIPFASPRLEPITDISIEADRLVPRNNKEYWTFYQPVGHLTPPEKFKDYPGAVRVEQGQVIGYVGDTGQGWGYIDWPNRPNREKFPPWDADIHVHFEVCRRSGRKLSDKQSVDPYGIGGKAAQYPDPNRPNKKVGDRGPVLFELDDGGLPAFAKRAN